VKLGKLWCLGCFGSKRLDHDFRQIDWDAEFAADPLEITGEGPMNCGDLVTIQFLCVAVERYSNGGHYHAQLVAMSRIERRPMAEILLAQVQEGRKSFWARIMTLLRRG
jgi:hypothetical protein